jgi:rhodanese-related sulfurtransferase
MGRKFGLPGEAAFMEMPPVVPASELDAHLQDAVLLDVRRPEEIAESGTLPGAILIPIEELPDRLSELPTDRPILTA